LLPLQADIGQGEDIEPARAKAEMMGIKQIYIEDLREEFVRDYVFPMFRANPLYEGAYLPWHFNRAAFDCQTANRNCP
jgi:argininosuccinate synthase